MSGTPHRTKAKKQVQARLSQDVYESIVGLLDDSGGLFTSFSQLVETIIFLSAHMYIEEPDNGYVKALAKLMSERTLDRIEKGHPDPEKHVHMTIDIEALGFIDMLVARYPMVANNRSVAINLILFNIGRTCNTKEDRRYYTNRLQDVLSLHPVRKRKR